tara:strand:+ start:1364 stop:1690 length:327 start_codon:yes stop_codon:yes gene_type:complete
LTPTLIERIIDSRVKGNRLLLQINSRKTLKVRRNKMKASIKLIEKDQIWQNETTIYWFDVDGTVYGISDCCGEIDMLDSEACPINHTDAKEVELYEALVVEYENHIND